MKRLRLPVLACLLAASLTTHAQEASRLVVGFPPGGTLDVLARATAQAIAEESGQSVIVENQPGAGGLLAAQSVAKAKPDGRTLLIAPVVLTAFFPHLYRKLSFDPLRDLQPVAELGTFNFALVVGAAVPVQSVSDWVAYVKARPGKVQYASFGAGTPSHFVGAMLNQAAGIDMLHVPYKGAAPAIQAVLTGEVQAAFVLTGGATLQQIKAGKIKALAVTGATRSPLLPDVPTFSESGLGLKAMENASLWYGFFAPAGTPPAAIERWHATLTASARSPSVRDVLAREDIVPAFASTADFAQKIQRDFRNWGDVIRATGFKLEE